MSDDLIKRLREIRWRADLMHEAADRIEQLEESNKELTLQLLATSGQAADALDKLAKAMGALRSTDSDANHGAMTSTYSEKTLRYLLRQIRDRARKVLAELEGK